MSDVTVYHDQHTGQMIVMLSSGWTVKRTPGSTGSVFVLRPSGKQLTIPPSELKTIADALGLLANTTPNPAA